MYKHVKKLVFPILLLADFLSLEHDVHRLDRKLTKGSMRKLPRSIKRDKSKFTNTKLDEAGMLILSYKAKLEAAIIQLTMLKR